MENKYRTLSFQDSHGHLVAAMLAEPPTKGERAVVLCHGFLSNKHSNTNRRLTELLLPQGISTFCFDWFGMGESEGAFADITLERCCDQLEGALTFVCRQGYSRIGLIGSSFGGLISILVANRHAHLLALGLKCPVPDFAEMLRLEFGDAAIDRWKETGEIPNMTQGDNPISLRYDFYENCLQFNAYDKAAMIKTPTRIVHGVQDEVVPFSQIQRLAHSLGIKKELHLIEGANHQFGRPEDFRQMTNLLGNWMVTHLIEEPS